MTKLKQLRREQKKSQADLAVALEVSVMTIGGWERGTSIPTPDNAQRLAEYFGVTEADLELKPRRRAGYPTGTFNNAR